MTYTIGEISTKLNIPISTIRFYDKKGLLSFVERSKGGARIFKESDLIYLSNIKCLKNAGMPLSKIKMFIDLYMQGDDTVEQRLDIILSQKKSVKNQIEQLQEQAIILDFKEWYYHTLIKKGRKYINNLSKEDIPSRFHKYLYEDCKI